MNEKTFNLIERLIDAKIELAVNSPRGMSLVGGIYAAPAIEVKLREIAALRDAILEKPEVPKCSECGFPVDRHYIECSAVSK